MRSPGKKTLKRALVSLLAIALLTTGIAAFTGGFSSAADYSVIRVKLSVGTPTSLNFKLSGNYGIQAYSGLNLSTGSYSIKLSGGSLQLCSGDSVLYTASSLKIVEQTPPSVERNYATITTTKYGTQKYLGDFEFRISSGSIMVINHVYLEYYLYGVVPHEMSNTWPMEALKAQAVAARTYAVKYMTGSGTYDVVDTAANQVYKGYSSSYDNAIAAVDATSKQVLKCNGQIVQAYFSASNGGYTEIPQHVWSAKATLLPYHVIQEDPYDTQNTWSEEEVLIFPKTISDASPVAYQYMSSGSMKSGTGSEADNAAKYFRLCALPAVSALGYTAYVTDDIEIIGVDSIVPNTYEDQHGLPDYNGDTLCACYEKADVTMRVYAIRNATAEEQSDTGSTTVREAVTVTFTIDLHVLDATGGAYRAFNNTSLRLFVVTETDTGWNIYHRRFGHGIGLSQRGAQTRAKAGQTWQEILSFYYPSTTLETLNISAPVPKAPADDDTNALVVNCSISVNVRSTPDTTLPAIGKALAGDRITVTQAFITPEWHQIDFGGIEAYIYAYYVKLDEPESASPAATDTEPSSTSETPTETVTATATPTATPVATPTATPTVTTTVTPTPTVSPTSTATTSPVVATVGTVTSSTLNVRTGPSTSYTKIGTLKQGDKVSIVQAGTAGGWHKILYNNNTAYVYANYMTAATTPAIAATGAVTSSTLNVRSGPGTSYSKIGVLAKGDTVQIVHAGAAGGWHMIWYNNDVAYVYANYVKVSEGNTVETTGVVTSSTLNVRSGPGTSYSRLGTLAKGDTVQVVQSYCSDSWHRIRYNSIDAYVHASYISLAEDTNNTPDSIPTTVYATVNANRLNFRQAASLDSAVIATLTRNTVVQVLEQGDTWFKVKYAGNTGYVYASYMKICSESYGTVSSSRLNVRSGPSTSYAVLGVLSAGDIVQVLENNGTWLKIVYQSTTAYVYAAYVDL